MPDQLDYKRKDAYKSFAVTSQQSIYILKQSSFRDTMPETKDVLLGNITVTKDITQDEYAGAQLLRYI